MTRASALAREPRARDMRGHKMMRAAALVSPGRMAVVEERVLQPGDMEVRVRLEGCGVCASNIPPFEGRDWFKYPMDPGALGHEGWGVVDGVGAGVSRFSVGERVALLSGHAYAEYDVAAEDQVVALPAELRGRPFPAEPLGCAMNIFRRSEIRSGQMVAIVGLGFWGAVDPAYEGCGGAGDCDLAAGLFA